MEKPQNYLSRLRRHPLLWNLALIAAIILAMAVAAHILMQLGTRHGARRTVPDLSGVQLDQAQRIARKHDLQLHINDSLFVPAYEGGIVLDQLPEGGVEVKPGRTVYITINSFRQKMVPVPYVAGRSLRQAKNMLEIAGLEIAELDFPHRRNLQHLQCAQLRLLPGRIEGGLPQRPDALRFDPHDAQRSLDEFQLPDL